MSGCLGCTSQILSFRVQVFPWAIWSFTSETWMTHEQGSLLPLPPPPTSVSLPATSPGASLSDRPPRPLWWWPYLLYALSVWKDKGESYLNSRDAHTLSRLQLNEKHLLFTERPSLVCSCNPLILQIETKNWSDFLGSSSWLDTESLVILLYMCPPTISASQESTQQTSIYLAPVLLMSLNLCLSQTFVDHYLLVAGNTEVNGDMVPTNYSQLCGETDVLTVGWSWHHSYQTWWLLI